MASKAHNILGASLMSAALAVGGERAYNAIDDAIHHQNEICETDVHATAEQRADGISTKSLRQDCDSFDAAIEEVAGGAIGLLLGAGGLSVARRIRRH